MSNRRKHARNVPGLMKSVWARWPRHAMVFVMLTGFLFRCAMLPSEVPSPEDGDAKKKPVDTTRGMIPQPSTTPDQQPTGREGPPPPPPPRPAPPRHGHPPETEPGTKPHGSGNNNGAIAGGAAAGLVTALVIGELIHHHNAAPEHFGKEGPKLAREFDMTNFTVEGLVGPNWPVVLDFMLDAPGAVQVDITAADGRTFRQILPAQPNRRGYQIFRTPANFGSTVQRAVFQVQSISLPVSSTPSPLRTYGMGAGERAVGSVAIDQLTFQPSTIHPKSNEVATFGFHAHSAFNAVRAEFIMTSLYNGHILVQQDQEEKLSPIPEGERARGTWAGKGKAGEHMLQVRAWRGLENGGDWVVAWSPDIVEVIK
jgi:hypothetical protein